MKKLFQAAVLFAAMAVLFVSCKSHEKCPAYGEMKKSHHVRATG